MECVQARTKPLRFYSPPSWRWAISSCKFLLLCSAIKSIAERFLLLRRYRGGGGTPDARLGGNAWSFFAVLLVWGGVVAALYSVGLALLEGGYSGSKLASANAAFVMLYSAGRQVGLSGRCGNLYLESYVFAVVMALFPAISLTVATFGEVPSEPATSR